MPTLPRPNGRPTGHSSPPRLVRGRDTSAPVAGAALLAVGLAAAASGCAVPAFVDGILAGQDFSVRCDQPLAQRTNADRDIFVMVSERSAETMSTVGVRIPAADTLALHDSIAVGTGAFDDLRPSLEVTTGALDVQTRPDGVPIYSPKDATSAQSVAGTLMLTARDGTEVSGSFTVALDDGGFVEGAFTSVVVQ